MNSKWNDILTSDAIYLLPCLLKWCYDLVITRKVSKVSPGLYHYKGSGDKTILVLHGMHSYPFLMHSISKLASKSGPVFSVRLSYDKSNPSIHRIKLKKVLNKIEKDFGYHEFILIGHSMGGIESAHLGFVDKDPRVKGVIAIASRLKYDEKGRKCLKSCLNDIHTAIQSSDLPLYQIAGKKDWNASIDSMIVRKESSHIIESAHHFDILFHKELKRKIEEVLNQWS